MYIENIWGIFFCMYISMILTIYGTYKAGIEEGKRKKLKTDRKKKMRRLIGDE